MPERSRECVAVLRRAEMGIRGASRGEDEFPAVERSSSRAAHRKPPTPLVRHPLDAHAERDGDAAPLLPKLREALKATMSLPARTPVTVGDAVVDMQLVEAVRIW